MLCGRPRIVRRETALRFTLTDALFRRDDKACPASEHASAPAGNAIGIQPETPIIGQVEMRTGKRAHGAGAFARLR